MRIVRWLVVIVTLAIGLLLGVAYPWAVSSVGGYEIGSWRILGADRRFQPFEPSIGHSEAPVRVWVFLSVPEAIPVATGRTLLRISLEEDGRETHVATLAFASEQPMPSAADTDYIIYREMAFVLDPVEADRHRLTMEWPRDIDPATMARIHAVDVTLQAGAFDMDPRVPWVGYGFIALAALIALLGRRRKPPPVPPRWGRG